MVRSTIDSTTAKSDATLRWIGVILNLLGGMGLLCLGTFTIIDLVIDSINLNGGVEPVTNLRLAAYSLMASFFTLTGLLAVATARGYWRHLSYSRVLGLILLDVAFLSTLFSVPVIPGIFMDALIPLPSSRIFAVLLITQLALTIFFVNHQIVRNVPFWTNTR